MVMFGSTLLEASKEAYGFNGILKIEIILLCMWGAAESNESIKFTEKDKKIISFIKFNVKKSHYFSIIEGL